MIWYWQCHRHALLLWDWYNMAVTRKAAKLWWLYIYFIVFFTTFTLHCIITYCTLLAKQILATINISSDNLSKCSLCLSKKKNYQICENENNWHGAFWPSHTIRIFIHCLRWLFLIKLISLCLILLRWSRFSSAVKGCRFKTMWQDCVGGALDVLFHMSDNTQKTLESNGLCALRA